MDGRLEIDDISLPPDVEKRRLAHKAIKASYQFEVIASVRGVRWDLSRRLAGENSTIFRKYGELFPQSAHASDRQNHDVPELFTAFLSARQRVNKRRDSLGFSLELGVLVPEYEVDGTLFLDNHYPGGYIFRDKINLEATVQDDGSWKLAYGFDSNTPNRATKQAPVAVKDHRLEFRIPIQQPRPPGIDATLVLTATNWNG